MAPFMDEVRQVIATGEPVTREVEYPYPAGTEWRAYTIVRFSPSTALAVSWDVTDRRRAEAALAESAARQAFLVRLNDALAPLVDPVEVQETAARVLGEHLGADRVAYFELDGDDYVVARDYAPSVPKVAGRHPVARFGARLIAVYRSGTTEVSRDVEADPALSPGEKAAFAAIQVRAQVAVPLVKAGALVAGLAVHTASPRAWTPAEVALVEETAGRTWASVERARAEAALREYAENLRRSNEDLERFAYVSSHDLQEPLRAIVSFSQLLERRYQGQLDADADEYIDFIVEGGIRMQTLIQDLLAYSRVNTTRQELRPTDMEDVMAAVERNLDLQLREAGAVLTHDPLPMVMADPLQLEQVFANLVATRSSSAGRTSRSGSTSAPAGWTASGSSRSRTTGSGSSPSTSTGSS